jgi:hypothetical protein
MYVSIHISYLALAETRTSELLVVLFPSIRSFETRARPV